MTSKKHSMHESRKRGTVSHINRIVGQLETLRRYVEEGRPCADVSLLATSITKSCDGLRMRTLEGFVLNEVTEGKLSPKKRELLKNLIETYKK